MIEQIWNRSQRREAAQSVNAKSNFKLVLEKFSCSGFVLLIFLIFSFNLSLAPSIKTHTKTQEIAETLFFKIFRGSMPPDLLEVHEDLLVGKIRVRPPPKNF